MKVIIASHPECDFLGHGISVGCYENNYEVSEFPYVRSLHGQVDDWYFLQDGKRGMSAPPGYMQLNPLPPNEKTEEEVIEAARDADFIIAHSTRAYALAALDKIITCLGKNPGNIIIADGEDHSYLPFAALEHFAPLVFFKREYMRCGLFDPFHFRSSFPIWPLPFACFTRGMPTVDDKEKTLNFFLSLGNTHPIRNRLLGKCLEADIPLSYIATDWNNPIRYEHPLGTRIQGMFPWPEYIKTQAQAKIGAACVGFGHDTLHALEGFSHLTAMLYQDPGIYIPHPFVDRQHCVYFNEDCQDVPEKLRWLLADNGYCRDIAAAGKRHCREFHTTKARVEYLISLSTKVRNEEKIYPEEFGLF